MATYNFADHGGWLPKLKFFSNRPWCRDLGSNGPKNQHSLEEQFWNFATTPLIVAPVRMMSNYDGFQDKTDHQCMVAGVELETNAIGHEMSHQQFINNEKRSSSRPPKQTWNRGSQIFPDTDLHPFEKTGGHLYFHCENWFALRNLYLGPL